MMTVDEVRRARLNLLLQQFGKMANLAEKLGLARNEAAKLSRIANANVRHERDGKLYNMGGPMARLIEEKLGLARGWMDTPIGYEDDHEQKKRVWAVFEKIPENDRPKAIRLLDTLAQPEPVPELKNGTEHH